MTTTSRTDALAAASNFDEYETHVVVLTQTSKGSPELYRLNLTDDLSARFRSMAHQVGTGFQQRTLVKYAVPRLLANHEIYWLETKQAPVWTAIQSNLERPLDLAILDPKTKPATNIRMYFVSIKSPERNVYFYAALTPRARLARGGRLAVMYSDGTYSRLKREVLVFDPRFDGVIVDDYIFTTAPTKTERLLGILEEIEKIATETFDKVTENVAIKNLLDFKAAVSKDINMMRKMTSIADKMASDPTYLEAMAMDKILAFLKERPQIEIDVEGTGSSARFVFFNDPQRRWRILHLLDDDYLHSPLTELDYEVNSKDLLGEAP